MEVRNLIKPNATVVKITEISVGDVYKRLETPTYGDAQVVYGVVIDMLNNGEQASIVALEFVPTVYATDIKASTKVLIGGTDVSIFPATVAEYRLALSEATEVQEREVRKAEQDFLRKRAVLEHMQEQLDAVLSTPKVLEVTQ